MLQRVRLRSLDIHGWLLDASESVGPNHLDTRRKKNRLAFACQGKRRGASELIRNSKAPLSRRRPRMGHPALGVVNYQRMRALRICFALSLSAALVAGTQLAFSQTSARPVADARRSWSVYGGGPDNIHYSSLDQINRENVHSLQVAWTFDTGDAHPQSEMECNPIVVEWRVVRHHTQRRRGRAGCGNRHLALALRCQRRPQECRQGS